MANPNGRPVKLVTDHGFYNSGGSYKTRIRGEKTKACQLWENIRSRIQTLPRMNESKYGKYSSVTICPTWLDFQTFAAWFETLNVPADWVLDKDLLGFNHYGPESCVFIPDELNKALSIKPRVRGNYPLGVSLNKNTGKLDIRYDCKDTEYSFRIYTCSSNLNSAWELYRQKRIGYIRSLGEKYKNDLDVRAYAAIMKYDVSMED